MKIIDIHTHGINGFDTKTVSEGHILKISEIHGKHGVSEIVPTVYSSGIETMRRHMLAIKKAIELQSCRGERPLALENQKSKAKIIGIHLEGPFLNPSTCGALDAGSFIEPNEYDLRKLVEGFEDIIKIITIAPELKGALKTIKSISDMEIIASMGHSDATYSEAEEGFHSGAKGITHIFNAMRGIHHREPGIAGFGLMNKDVYIEVIADPFHLDQKIIELIFSTKNPDRIIIVSDTVKDTKPSSASQGVRSEENRILGGSLTVRKSSERLIKIGIDEEIVLKAVSENPVRYLGTV
jgi:N-acetylglucosamine-6-phosphate deacetylase